MSPRSTHCVRRLSKGALSAALAPGLILRLAPNVAALSSSSSVFPATPGPAITQPAPRGEAVSLYELRDSGTAAKGPVVIGGKQFPNSWSFNPSTEFERLLGQRQRHRYMRILPPRGRWSGEDPGFEQVRNQTQLRGDTEPDTTDQAALRLGSVPHRLGSCAEMRRDDRCPRQVFKLRAGRG